MDWWIVLLALGCSWVAYRLYDGDLFNPLLVAFLYGTVFFFFGLSYAEQFEPDGIFLLPKTRLFVVYAYLVVFAVLVAMRLRVRPGPITFHLLPDHESSHLWTAWGLLAGSGVVAAALIVSTGFNPFSGQGFEASRVQAREGLGVVSLAMIATTSVAALILATSYRVGYLGKAVALVVACLVLYSTGNRAPLLRFLLSAMVLVPMASGKRLTLPALATGAAALLFVMAALGAVRKGIEGNFTALASALLDWRPFVTIQNFDLILRSDLGNEPLLGQSFFIELQTLAPGYQPNFGTWLKGRLGLTFEGGSITPSYLGVSYVDFGLAGILLAPFAYSLFLGWVAGRNSRARPRSRLAVIFLLQVSLGLAGVFTTGVTTPLLYNLLPLGMTFLIFRFMQEVFHADTAGPRTETAAPP